jgi:hypothetical protein
MSAIPNETIPLTELRRISIPIYGMKSWNRLFTPRQALALATLASAVRKVPAQFAVDDGGIASAVQTCLALACDRQADYGSSLCRWVPAGEFVGNTFGRQAIGMVWDFCEVPVLSDATGGFSGATEWVANAIEANVASSDISATVQRASATSHPLPDDSAVALITDPPYYDAVPYSHLSDFFYVWLKRALFDVHQALFSQNVVEKTDEIVVDRPHSRSKSSKDVAFYESALQAAFTDCRRVVAPSGIGTIVFASKTTASWEAILRAIVEAGWTVTGSWPIDTEMEARIAAKGQARLASSIHLVCRPRENADGNIREEVGEWRDVLSELPKRIHEWMPRLAAEGVVGADAIFACLGPALEIFSRYSRVEKASGEAVPLREYLEQVWAAVSTEALSMIFRDADAAGLEPDARLTAMWLWTLGGVMPGTNDSSAASDGDEDAGDDDEPKSSANAFGGFTLEFDAARKIAQGLGIHLEQSDSVVEVKGDKARLLPVGERLRHLFGKSDDMPATKGKRKAKVKQRSLFEELDEIEADSPDTVAGELKPQAGNTVLDRVHQSMILFGSGRGEALRRFLVEDGAGKDARFWKLAQSLSALYPGGTDEKRWVDGVLARKKGLAL